MLDLPSVVANEHAEQAFIDGFKEGTATCVKLLTKDIDALTNKISAGKYLSEQEQFLLSNLISLKSAMEQSLRDYESTEASSER